MKIDVTVIVLTYNSDWEKLRMTISSILVQKDINYEIVITDDCSQVNCIDELKRWLKKSACRVIYNIQKNNTGTIKNCIAGLNVSKGEYVYLISPGDFLYDEHTLSRFYRYANSNHSEIIFGRAIFYQLHNNKINIISDSAPKHPEIFAKNKSLSSKKAAFFFGNFILGASYFRKREMATKYFNIAGDIAKYAEDSVSTSFALCDGVQVEFVDMPICWYEYGTGISTNHKWDDILNQEYKQTYMKLKSMYPNDAVVDSAYKAKVLAHSIVAVLFYRLQHPSIFLQEVFYRCKNVLARPKVICNKNNLLKIIEQDKK